MNQLGRKKGLWKPIAIPGYDSTSQNVTTFVSVYATATLKLYVTCNRKIGRRI